ncbi:hypothetical protein [Paenibacillus sp. NPDC058174]|uniref:hypothetical protein n=1 Tax=Paenibacillus sp. NPDC058174 TaxID=3346366 RepID=UPI0036D78638
MGHSRGAEIGPDRKNILAPHVNSLDFVSVREKSAIPFVKTMKNGKVPFLVFPVSDHPQDPKSMDSRLIALLDTFGLSSCYVYDPANIPNIDDVTFHHIDESKTSAFHHHSLQFLKNALES